MPDSMEEATLKQRTDALSAILQLVPLQAAGRMPIPGKTVTDSLR
jgi:hypothetical protein